ncbi:dehydrogenase [Halogeometricum borinquense DSM 11551]|uniref:Dehydrogenase n=1 Tax=Halogeometricum borinquense (strain ATCC 700274 / DSM 11551 / JCM 10706 / KCTC 4070 / PR3) TaxID=469382 RepID=E4NR23_HALBP|nr:Gfo/Idh/MocA family oxidoreductase [Halogeometricum borinquense]ADQ66759.1 predicted dehydrogenase [Halogeometricum borinquense DSM 11551]ELY30267.1 dehydrogenase [Halogeometricum borinquense DSM 11551]
MTLNVAVLGYRFMGKAHSNALARLPMFFPDAPDVHRHTLIGRDEEALASAADELGFEHTATDWESVVDEVDAFYNLGPNHIHAEPSIAALKADTPVFCEKPLAPTLDEAEKMRDAAADSDAIAGCAFNYRFVPAIQYAKGLIDDGTLGEIRHVRGSYMQDWLTDADAPWSWRNDAKLAGSGALGDLGAHTIDLARFLVGDVAGDIERISGNLQTFVAERPVEGTDETRPVTVDDAYSAQATFENGAMGTFEASRVADGHKNDHTIRIHGSEGSLRFSLERLNELEYKGADHRGYETILMTDADDPYLDHWWPPGHVLGWEHTFVHENYEFLSAIRDGVAFSPSFEAGYAVQQILDAIERSDDSGEWVSL